MPKSSRETEKITPISIIASLARFLDSLPHGSNIEYLTHSENGDCTLNLKGSADDVRDLFERLEFDLRSEGDELFQTVIGRASLNDGSRKLDIQFSGEEEFNGKTITGTVSKSDYPPSQCYVQDWTGNRVYKLDPGKRYKFSFVDSSCERWINRNLKIDGEEFTVDADEV